MKSSKTIQKEYPWSQLEITSQPSSQKDFEESVDATSNGSKKNSKPIYLKRI